MNLSEKDLKDLASIAIAAAQEAGAMIASYAGQKIDYEKKETGASLASQVVTEVDRMSEEIVLRHLNQTLEQYDLGMLAEETEDDGSRFEKDYFWSVDPMDGTLPFIEDRPGYAVSIGLTSREGVPYIGVVYDPREHILYHAVRGIGVFRNNKPWSLVESSGETQLIKHGGAVMNMCWILEHGNAYFLRHPKKKNGCGCVWDYAAVACLFEVMGAWVSDIYGDPLDLNRKELPYMNHRGLIFATNEKIAREFLQTPIQN